jgi:ribosomal protein S18 acetylase RimI-like enzyme
MRLDRFYREDELHQRENMKNRNSILTKIRSMTAADKPAVIRLLKNTSEFLPREVDLAEEVIDEYLSKAEKSGYYISVIEIKNSDPAGYIVYGRALITDNVWEIYWLAVDRSLQGQGAGQRLLEYVEQQIWQDGGAIIVLETSSRAEYDRTNRFYTKAGYIVCGRVEDFYMPGDDRITYQKRLKSF